MPRTLLTRPVSVTTLKECYDDAMNAADEHGIIHPGTCPSPINGVKRPAATAKDTTSSNGNGDDASAGEGTASAPGDDSSLKSKSIADSQSSPAVARPETPDAEGEGNGDGGGAAGDDKKEAPAGGGEGPVAQAAGEVVRPILLSALQELSELARPEIAASAVVAGACKVSWLVDPNELIRVSVSGMDRR